MVSEDTVKRYIVAAIRKADLNTVSAKQIRRTVENQLDLRQDELASGRWKAFVKSVINETVESIEHGKPLLGREIIDDEIEPEVMPKKKRRRIAVMRTSPPSSPRAPEPMSPGKKTYPRDRLDKRESSGVSGSLPMNKQSKAEVEESDSGMSVLNDSMPPPSKSRQESSKQSRRLKSTTKPDRSTAKVTNAKSTIPSSEVEIQHLKTLVHKCGVRKIWSKELPASMSSSQQISHLKSLLNSLGMTGRLSVEKAKKIKEQRELNDELAFIQEGARNVGEGKRRRN